MRNSTLYISLSASRNNFLSKRQMCCCPSSLLLYWRGSQSSQAAYTPPPRLPPAVVSIHNELVPISPVRNTTAAALLLLSECICTNTSCWKCLHRARNVNSSEIYIRSKLAAAGDEVYYDVIKIVLVWGELLQLHVSIIISQEHTSQSASTYLLIPFDPIGK